MAESAKSDITLNKNTIYSAPEGFDAQVLIEQARLLMPQDRVLVHVALDDTRLSLMKELISFFSSDVELVCLPAWDCLPYDRVSPNSAIVSDRVKALGQLIQWDNDKTRSPRILLTTVNALSQRVMPQSALENSALIARKGGQLDVGQFKEYMAHNGYTRSETVRETGEFAMRGGIIDIFPAGAENPYRMDLFGDEIETLKTFDAITQRTIENVDELSLMPVSEYFLTPKSIEKFRSTYRAEFGVPSSNDPLYESISQGRRFNGMEHWLPLFYDQMNTVLDYAPNAQIIMDHHAFHAYEERIVQIKDFYAARKTLESTNKKNAKSKDVSLTGTVYHPLSPSALYIDEGEWEEINDSALYLSPFAAPNDVEQGAKKSRDFADIRALPDGDLMGELRQYIATLTRKTIIACYSEGARQRLKTMMEGASIAGLTMVDNSADIKKLNAFQVGLAVISLEHGFVAKDLAVLTEQDILGDRLARRSSKRKKADNFLREVSALNEGDLVTHIDHGIGKFINLETVTIGKIHHDCLKIEYQGGDKLFVPVENIEVLSRFGSDEGTVQLDKLGGAGWQARKAKVKKDLMEMADGLLKIAAARQLNKTESIQISRETYNAFAARFPYTETEDQERAIEAVIESLAGTHPMDRLVCGDVGFGKTEVAIRAAYVAAMDGYQVAIVAPTTLLARQHYQNFMRRFTGTGLRVEQLSRMVSAKDAERVRAGLTDGSVNIVIGTHALFSESIKFSNLGLMIIDEEQRFGVKQKERLKELKTNVHVLTLTATPIPRTLQMALTGVKEMSLITTPPVDRLAVRTFVMPMDQVIIREALLREYYRGGQSFYVCPRVKDMQELEDMLKELVPEVKVISAHGQMSATDLEDRMSTFYDGQYDVLLATNIIESGIDIPSANTMVVHRADMFGLSQLYQIRGRIGRSKVRAYAYLTYQGSQILSEQAQKRLEVMETLDTLGSGFQLASHDMDIRGAGNLLGDKQSGHIKEIGVELYQQMLEEAVAMAREGVDIDDLPISKDWSPTINIGTSVMIPETYIEDLGVRMSIYRRIAELKSDEDIDSFAAELVDRFGDMPDEVKNLLDIVSIKILCKAAGVSHVEAGPKGAVIAYHDNTPPNVEGLMHWMTSKRGLVKLRPDQKISITGNWDTPYKRVDSVQKIMKELVNL
ncbi:MAG: transcription-repair coupling factor [Micavibrio sp.]|nr:transcription-repair coupling factor [Micavibrio sp.]